jgi:MazG family protein
LTRRAHGDIRDLLAIMRRLRSPGGCPWDREQTLDSLRQYLVEECYEVIDALESGDPAKHAEELGDLLLQVVFHAQIRRERGEFGFADVVAAICDKLIRRHPHVFRGLRVSGAAEVLRNWDAIKAGEKASGPTPPPATRSVIGSVPRHLPALHKAHHIQKRVARVGFDWTAVHDVIAKIEEELGEVREALARGDTAHIKEEIGDLLFAVANLSRFQGINPEEALDRTVAKFIRRFQTMETRLARQGRPLAACSLAELDAAWNAVKADE